jgi:outer membrane protein, multidrug efflux system
MARDSKKSHIRPKGPTRSMDRSRTAVLFWVQTVSGTPSGRKKTEARPSDGRKDNTAGAGGLLEGAPVAPRDTTRGAEMRRLLALSLLTLALFGCTVGPDYVRPKVDAPSTWRFEDKQARDLANTRWWEQFQDPVLDELILIALAESKNVGIAAARVEEFVGRYGAIRANQFPQVAGNALVSREQVNVPQEILTNTFRLLGAASWEIDLFGRLRRSTEAARADLLSSEEARRAVVLSLVSSVAASYVNLRDLDQQLEIARATLGSRAETLHLFERRFEGGVISELDLQEARADYENVAAQIPRIEIQIAQQEDALSVLLGRNPYAIPRGRPIDRLVLPGVPAGLPSDLLERRPDIRQAEQDLVAANARIGVAKAQYFPVISLTGFLGLETADLSNLSKASLRTWGLAVPMSVPIFTAGGIAGQVHAAEAQQRQALLSYQQTIQTAFQEVNDALIDQRKSREQLAAQGREVFAQRERGRLARLRYNEGLVSYLEVLDADRNLFSAELAYTQTEGLLFTALVNLYQAMGGGWVIQADRLAAAQDPWVAPSVHAGPSPDPKPKQP